MPSLQRCVFLAMPTGAMSVRGAILVSVRWLEEGAQQQCSFQAPSPVFRRQSRRHCRCHLQAPSQSSGASPGAIGGAICKRHLRLQVPIQAPLEARFVAPFQAGFRCHVRRTPKAIQVLHQALFKAGLGHHLGAIGDALGSPISGVIHNSQRAPVRLFLWL